MVDQDQVGDANLAEIHAEGVDPEMVLLFGVARGDVPRDAFVKPEFGEEAEGGGQPLFPMLSLLLDRIESRRHRQIERAGWGDHRFFWHRLLLSFTADSSCVFSSAAAYPFRKGCNRAGKNPQA